MSTRIEVEVIADSISQRGDRITTIQGICPRFIWAEVLTHRVFSRNAQSNRAIPVSRIISDIQDSPVYPLHWGANQAGMQAYEEVDLDLQHDSRVVWGVALDDAIAHAEQLYDFGIHKQIANRLLEPFQHIRFIITATEWSNFFNLRLAPDAEPHIRKLAETLQDALRASKPIQLLPGEWHLPYITAEDMGAAVTGEFESIDMQVLLEASVARCARVSYNNHDNSKPDIEKDRKLFAELLKAGHLSPFEHQAIPMLDQGNQWEVGVTHKDRHEAYWSGNFRGFRQYRQIIQQVY
jgi:thymidylate synthase ThyX